MTTVPPAPNLEIKSHHCISVYSETSARVLHGSVADTHLPKSNHVETVPYGVGDGQESLVCCNSWGRKESDTTE